jgi:hypothetical protein
MNTNFLFGVEVLVLLVLFGIQIYSFRKTKQRIGEMGTAVEDSGNLVVSRLSVPVDDLNQLTPEEILRNRAIYSGYTEDDADDSSSSYESDQSESQSESYDEDSSAEGDEEQDEYSDDSDESDDEGWDDDSEDDVEGYSSDEDEDEGDEYDYESDSSEGYEEESEPRGRKRVKRTSITIIEGPDTVSPVFRRILDTINTYIISTRTGSADFGLIKEVTERATETIEEEVNLTVSVPLFLGLVGTMLGIVLGVISMISLLDTQKPESPSPAPDPPARTAPAVAGADGEAAAGVTSSSSTDSQDNGLAPLRALLTSVALAMSVSLIGLFLTTLNSGWFLKKEKILMDARKNDFYTFMQTSLLPVIDQGMGSTLQSLQVNLSKFNHEFSSNLQDLNHLFGDIGSVLKNQRDVMDKLENMDVTTLATYNVRVLSELTQSLDALESFKQHLAIVVTGVEKTDQLIGRLDSMLERTSGVADIATRLEATVSEGKALIDFLTKHKDSLEKFEQSTSEAISETGLGISDMFKQLESHIGESIQQISNFTAEEAIIIRDAVSEGRLNLGNLAFLENINDVLRTMRDNAEKTNSALTPQLDKMTKSMENLNRVLAELEKKVGALQPSGGLRGIFGGGRRSGDGS